jgi:hypothetical protein
MDGCGLYFFTLTPEGEPARKKHGLDFTPNVLREAWSPPERHSGIEASVRRKKISGVKTPEIKRNGCRA